MVSTVAWWRSKETLRARLGSPWVYVGAVLCWSWLFWAPLALTAGNASSPSRVLLLGLGAAGPLVAALALLYLTQSPATRADYWQRLVDWRRPGRAWWIVALALPVLWQVLGLATATVVGDAAGAWTGALAHLRRPLTLAPLVLGVLFFGALPGELGWRAYALERLPGRWSALQASLLLGAVWVLWRLPLLFVEGLPLAEAYVPGSSAFWVGFVAAGVAQAVLYTWLYTNTGRSTVLVLGHHLLLGVLSEFLALRGGLVVYHAVWVIFLAVAVTTIWGPRTLAAGEAEADTSQAALAL